MQLWSLRNQCRYKSQETTKEFNIILEGKSILSTLVSSMILLVIAGKLYGPLLQRQHLPFRLVPELESGIQRKYKKMNFELKVYHRTRMLQLIFVRLRTYHGRNISSVSELRRTSEHIYDTKTSIAVCKRQLDLKQVPMTSLTRC